jgi:site-specific DNA-methyltransferase (adenine-specific)
MKTIELAVSQIIPYEKNPRFNDGAVDAVAKSIDEFGFQQPLVLDKDYGIIVGHTRLKAAKRLGLETVPCVIADNLSDEQVKAYRLADNKVGELATWDELLLNEELEGIFDIDMSDFGFDLELEMDDEPAEVTEDDYEAEVPEEPKAKMGDIYQLGRHRLMCGDSTSITDVEKLMNGEKADMVFTDPPYNIAYQGVSDKRTIKNDKMGDDDFVDFLQQSIMVCDTVYVCCSLQYEHLFKRAMNNLGIPPKAMIIWNKVNPAQHLDKYFKQHEIIFYHGRFGGEKTLRGDIWECKRQRNTVHPTMKPVELIGMALEDNPDKKKVYDGFGGSGSTLIACEQLNRNCYMMELDPKYVDVIIDRWEQFTGEKAVLLNE